MNCERTITNLLPPRKAGAVRILGDRVLPHNVPTEEPPPPPFGVEPTDFRRPTINRRWARRVADLLALADLPLTADPPDAALCLRPDCGQPVEDTSECWCVSCRRELAKGA